MLKGDSFESSKAVRVKCSVSVKIKTHTRKPRTEEGDGKPKKYHSRAKHGLKTALLVTFGSNIDYFHRTKRR